MITIPKPPHLLFLSLLTTLIFNIVDAQEYLDWGALADVEFQEIHDTNSGLTLLEATFSDWLISMDGKEVSITGFMIPLDPFGTSYVLSMNPNSSCFFCGGAGPESIIALYLKPAAVDRYETDDYSTFKGTLQLNKLNDKHFTYVLLNAEPI